MNKNINANLTLEELKKSAEQFFLIMSKNRNSIKNDIEILRKSESQSIPSQTCLIFVFADFMSRIYRIFQGTRGNDIDSDNKRRFINWMEKFVLSNKNSVYKIHKNLLGLNGESLWKLRNSFLHFYSFPSSKQMAGYVIFQFNVKRNPGEMILSELRKKHGTVYRIDIYCLIDAVLEGHDLFLKELSNQIDNDFDRFVDNLLYAYSILKNESTETLQFKDKKTKII